MAAPLSTQSGFLARRTAWPIPGFEPYRRKYLHVSRSGFLGDVLQCTPALREAKRLNPKCHITFYTRFKEAVNGLPFINEVRDFVDRPPMAITMEYEQYSPPTRHLARIMGEAIGLSVRNTRPSCVIDGNLVDYYSKLFHKYPRPRIIVNRNASSWTPNKAWPNEYWNELIENLSKKATVIEIGVHAEEVQSFRDGNYISLIGKTSIMDMFALIAAAEILVSPVSGPVHVAAAVGTRSVVIYGGYEHPVCTRYPGNICLYSSLPCSPCWLRTPCPHDRSCLRIIAPNRVERAAWDLARRDSK